MTSTSDVTSFDVACSFVHKVAARTKVLPYTDMVKWEINHLNIKDRNFKDSRRKNIGYFRADDLKAMYNLPDSTKL